MADGNGQAVGVVHQPVEDQQVDADEHIEQSDFMAVAYITPVDSLADDHGRAD